MVLESNRAMFESNLRCAIESNRDWIDWINSDGRKPITVAQ